MDEIQDASESASEHASRLRNELGKPEAFPDDLVGRVDVVETHISWVFLTPSFAYKVKKPISNEFIDYSTLERRRYCCEKELQLDSRFAPGLYVDVLPITRAGSGLLVGGSGVVYEYALRMVRFPASALLVDRLTNDDVSFEEISQLGQHIAEVHSQAATAPDSSKFGDPQSVLEEAIQNLDALESSGSHQPFCDQAVLRRLRQWTLNTFDELREKFHQRKQQHFIRECHGDLHAGNIVTWQSQLVAFDGIEFNDGFRWIDTLSDLAFLAMDLAVRKHQRLSQQLINSYLETSGDYASLELLRWYMVYRGLVRAKVDAMVLGQQQPDSQASKVAASELGKYLSYASHAVCSDGKRVLWITHGVSGSGKSTRALEIVRQQSAVRIRSDVERKRLAGIAPMVRGSELEGLYGPKATEQTYQRLCTLARSILTAGYSVVVDATFLKRVQREHFSRLATELGVPYQILDCQADVHTLQHRIAERTQRGQDPSDADIQVLHRQLADQEPLSDAERMAVV